MSPLFANRLFVTVFGFFALVLMAIPTQAEEPLDPRITPEVLDAFKANEYAHEGRTLPYRLLSPLDQKQDELYPLVLVLHGYGERGNDNQRQLIHGGSVLANQALRERHPAFVVAPQCSDENYPEDSGVAKGAPRVWTWGLSRETSSEMDFEKTASPQMAAVQSLVKELIQTLPIDPNRVYVTGLSMGGYGTWEIATRDPDVYAAAAPVCGGGDPNHAGRLAKLPLWAFHGAIDNVIPPERSREMVEAISNAGGRPIYTEYEGVGHGSWGPTYDSQQVWDWMFSQRRSSND